MKYITNQIGDKCLNCYNITMFSYEDLSVYAKIDGKKIKMGTFNTKEDAINEFNSILQALSNKSITVYRVNSERYWIEARMEHDINDMFSQEYDSATIDYQEEDYMDSYDDYIAMNEEDNMDQNVEDDISEQDIEEDEDDFSDDSVDNE